MSNKWNALAKLNKVKDLAPTPDVLNFFGKLTDAYKEDQITKRDIARIDAQKEVMIKAIEQKYGFYREIFDKVFDERKETINKFFHVIDKGIAEGNNEIISSGLAGLSQVVSSSPFANAVQLSEMLNSNQTIEI